MCQNLWKGYFEKDSRRSISIAEVENRIGREVQDLLHEREGLKGICGCPPINVSGVQVIAKGNTMDVQNLSREVDEAQTEVTLVVEYVGDSLQDRKGSGTVYKRLMSLCSQLKMTRTNWTT